LKPVFDVIISQKTIVTGCLLDVKNVVMRTMPT
ncbi:hypothetical protein B0H22_1151, partial [Methanohalophilus euhalobius]